MDQSPRNLPGVALESTLILAAERVIALFAAWMIAVIAVARAIAGDLPTEISGQGFKYADRDAAEGAAIGTRRALRELEAEVEDLQKDLLNITLKG